jgi:protein-S-isoprenylcysteine O-methyltransferase Ste14
MYAAVLLIVIGVLIAAGSIWGWAWGVVIAVFFLLKSRWEDSLLRREYGASWEEWAEATGGLVPRSGLRGPNADD